MDESDSSLLVQDIFFLMSCPVFGTVMCAGNTVVSRTEHIPKEFYTLVRGNGNGQVNKRSYGIFLRMAYF